MRAPPDHLTNEQNVQLPTAEEIDVHGSLDEKSAKEHFLNKSLEDAEAMFRENSAYYQEDLMWMGPRAFAFYLQAATRYLESPDSAGDAHLIDCLYQIVEFRSDQPGFEFAVDAVRELVHGVLAHYSKFQVDASVYGDLASKYAELRGLLAP